MLAVAEYDHRLAARHPIREDGDDARFAVWVLPRAVDVGGAQDLHPHGVRQQDGQVLLQRPLAQPVGADGPNRVVLVARQVLRLAVQRSPCVDVYELRASCRHRRLADVDPTHDVHEGVALRVGHRPRHRRLCRPVADHLRPEGDGRVQELRGADVEVDEPRLRVDVRPPSGRQVVHHDDLVSSIDQPVDDMGAYEPGSARYQDAQSTLPRCRPHDNSMRAKLREQSNRVVVRAFPKS